MKAGDRLPVVFVPGLSAIGATYRPFLKDLAHRHPVRSADHRLELPAELDWRFWHDTIDQAAGDWERFHLVGHSMGGAIALHYAAHHPDRVAKTAAVAPVLFPLRRKPRPWRTKLRNLVVAVLSGHGYHFVRSLLIFRQRAQDGRLAKLAWWAGSIDLSAELARLSQATVIWPTGEEVIAPTQLTRLRKDFSGIAVAEVPGKHLDLVFAPKRLLPAVREALHD